MTALRKPNTRGQWGQMQLRKVVELAGMVRHCDFDEQASLVADDATLRPDLVVNLPGGKHVVIDAKAPLQGVLDAYEARDDEERARHLADHARLLRKHVKQLADKSYWSGLDSAPDLVVMFLPGEHLYSAALEADPTLLEDAMARHVLIATPTTLLALLQIRRLRLAAGARRGIGAGGLRARARAVRQARQALRTALDARTALERNSRRLQRHDRVLRGSRDSGRPALRRARRRVARAGAAGG